MYDKVLCLFIGFSERMYLGIFYVSVPLCVYVCVCERVPGFCIKMLS